MNAYMMLTVAGIMLISDLITFVLVKREIEVLDELREEIIELYEQRNNN